MFCVITHWRDQHNVGESSRFYSLNLYANMVKRTATEEKRKGIEGCSNFLMEQGAAQNTKSFHWTEYNFRDYEKLNERELISGKY